MVKEMTSGSPMKLIFNFTIPILVGNIFQQLYNMVDTMIVGQFLGTEALAALGITGSMNFLVLGFVMGLTAGFGVIMAQRFGAQDLEGLRHSVASSIWLSVFMTIVITAASLLTMQPLLDAINTPANVMKAAQDYISIIYAGMFSQVLFNLLASVLRALGDSRTPLYFLIVASLLNVGLDLFFILVVQMGVGGAAVATVISQLVSGLLCLFYVIHHYPLLRFEKKDFRIDFRFWWAHMRLGLPMALQFSITAIGIIVLQGAINALGANTIAGYTAATKVEQLCDQPVNSIGTAMATYAGQNLGAGKIERIRKGVRAATWLALFCSLAAGAILLLFWEPFMHLFISGTNPEAMQAAKEYVWYIVPFLFSLGVLFIHRNTLQGIGRPFMPMMAGVAELVMRVVAALVLSIVIGYAGICLAGPIAWVGACVPLLIDYFYSMRRLEKNPPPLPNRQAVPAKVE